MTKVAAERLFLVFLIGIAVFLYWSTADFTGIAIKTSAKYIKFISSCIGLLALFQLSITYKIGDDQQPLNLVRNKHHFFVLLLSIILFAVSFPILGFLIATAIFIPLLSYGLGYRNWKVIIAVTAGFILFVYLIFVRLLSVSLPTFGLG